MAMRGRPLDVATIREIKRLRPILSLRATARETRTALNTVIKYAGKQGHRQNR